MIVDKIYIEFKDEKSIYVVRKTNKGEHFKFAFIICIVYDYLLGFAK